MAGYCLILSLGLIFWEQPQMRYFLSGSALFTASAIASATCFAAWRTLSRPASTIWLFFGFAATISTISHFSGLLHASAPRVAGVHYLWLGSYCLLLAAVVAVVHRTEQGRLAELALDVGLVVAAATLVVLRWAPGAQTLVAARSAAADFLIIFGPVIAISSLLIVGVLITGPQTAVAPRVLWGVFGAAGCLLISALPQIANAEPCCHTGEWTVFASIGTWAFVAYASVVAWQTGDLPLGGPADQRLRQVVAPAVAVVLAAISIDAALHPTINRRTALALGLLGALVALRLTDLLKATRLQVVERRELAQTRALVEVSRALAGKNDLDTTLSIVTKWAVRVLNARAASVELLTSDARTLELRAAVGLPASAIGMRFPVDASFTGWVILNGEARVTSNPRRDPYMTGPRLRLVGDSPMAAVPLRYRERMLGVISCVGNRPFDAADLDMLRAFANQTALALEDARLFEQVRALSVTDPLTGLANRRQLDRELTREFAAAQRGRRLVAVMFDLDDFKQHNDKYGHVAGDEALRLFADALRSSTRAMNLAARYGGDEFFALLADADLAGTEVFASRVKERFRRSMDAAGWPALQVSVGIAEFVQTMANPEDLMQAADRALYRDKLGPDVRA
ncbi:MAG TPA: sensor domain-containing diguanylate cyclase [Longimicrobiales bacterium]